MEFILYARFQAIAPGKVKVIGFVRHEKGYLRLSEGTNEETLEESCARVEQHGATLLRNGKTVVWYRVTG